MPRSMPPGRVGSREPPRIDGRYDAAGWDLIGSIRRHRRLLGARTPRVIDLGMGRGRDMIFLGRRGFRVFGVDRWDAAMERGRRRAARLGLRFPMAVADLRGYRFPHPFDVVFSSTTLNCLPPAERPRRFESFQRGTRPGGLHAINVFVRGQGLGPGPEAEPLLAPYRRGELRSYYRDWDVLEARGLVFPCASPGPAHRHAVEAIVARKPPA